MDRFRLLTDTVSGRPKILITPTRHPLGRAIWRQLMSLAKVEVVSCSHPAAVPADLAGIAVVVYVAQGRWRAESLHRLLDLTLAAGTKFVLVESDPASETASLITQFGQNFSLSYRLVDVSNYPEISSAAAAVIKSFLPSWSQPRSKQQKTGIDRGRVIRVISLIVILAPVLYLAQVAAMATLTACSFWAVKSGRWTTTINCGRLARQVIEVMRSQTPPVTPLPQILTVGERLADSLVLAGELGRQLPPQSTDVADISHSASALAESLAYLQADLRRANISGNWWEAVAYSRALVAKLQKLVPELPDLLPPTQPATYLVLIQDNTEQRPTGGFISHVALISTEGGRLTDMQLLATSILDSQLVGQVEPPEQLKATLGETSWYLRDSNWDPDFPSTASRAAWFVGKEMGREVDWVVGVNLSLLPQVLALTGPVRLPEFSLTVNQDNFTSAYLTHVKTGAAPPDFLGSLLQAVWLKLRQLPANRLAPVLFQALDSRQLMVASASSPSAALEAAGWDGKIFQPACRSQDPCLADVVYSVDTNVGVNKANAYVRRQLALDVNFGPDKAESALRINYTNSAPASAWPAGSYKNFLRVYLPLTTTVVGVTVEQKPVAASVTAEHGLTRVALLLDVPPQISRSVEVKFHADLPQVSRLRYQLDVPNQPGATADPLTLTLTYPAGWFVTTGQSPTVAQAGRLEYNALLSGPWQFAVDLAPN